MGRETKTESGIDLARVDPRQAKDIDGLTDALSKRSRELTMQRMARERQVAILEMEADLQASAHAIYERQRAAEKEEPRKPPEDAKSAQALLGRILAKCESAVEDVMKDYERRPHMGRLAVSAAQVAIAIGRLDVPGTDGNETVPKDKPRGRKS
jgi:hypothetical protein